MRFGSRYDFQNINADGTFFEQKPNANRLREFSIYTTLLGDSEMVQFTPSIITFR